MKTFIVKIDTGNDAFGDDPTPELSRILHEIAEQLPSRDYGWFQTILDVNGNDVGRYAFKPNEYGT